MIESIHSNLPVGKEPLSVKPKQMTEESTSFADTLKDVLSNVNGLQKESDLKTMQLATGEIEDLHEVMLVAQKATIALETTVQVQKKAVDAYNEIMRMQI